ncbi:MAG TPA: 50S ribosomal protein L9 [Candidatus Polarisedimenticolaceae bacterium]|nr:50S ribosomal protein L9 [Candidatus Polarisedimenticolaceae bacterium]
MSVKVVLRQDVDHLGDRGQIVNVAPGYARNYLIPKGLAYTATEGNLRVLELEKRAWTRREAKDAEEARGLAAKIAGLQLTVTKRAGENGLLYGSVTSSEIAELLEARGIAVDRRKIRLDDPIKQVGEFTIPVRLHRQVQADVSLQVLAASE